MEHLFLSLLSLSLSLCLLDLLALEIRYSTPRNSQSGKVVMGMLNFCVSVAEWSGVWFLR